MKLRKALLAVSPLALVAAAHAQDAGTGPDAAAITTQLTTGIDSGSTVATKVVGILVTLFVVGFIIKLVRKARVG